MKFRETMKMLEGVVAGLKARASFSDEVVLGRAAMLVQHRRPQNWLKDKLTGSLVPDPKSYGLVGDPEVVFNLITFPGRDFLHVQGYGSSGLGSNGLNYIGLSNDAVSETTASTVLSNEIVANGLSRAQGTVGHTVNTNTTTIDKTFTCATLAQAAQKAALFSAASSGTMCHVLGFTQRSLQVGDTLQATYTITLG